MAQILGPSQSQQFFNVDIFNGRFPAEGPKVVPVSLDFSVQQSYNVDLTLSQYAKRISVIQSLFFDNSLNATPLIITVNSTNQVLKLPGFSQGCVPVFAGDNLLFICACTGAQRATIYFTNVPMPACVWSATSSFTFNASGYLQVSDPVMDATVVANTVNISNNVTGNNNISKPEFAPDELFSGNTALAAAVNIITGTPSYFITSVDIFIRGDASLAAAGPFSVALKDGATTIATGFCMLPLGAGTNFASVPLLQLRGLQYNSKTSGANLSVTGSAALTTGLYYWTIAGGLCAQIGP